MAQLKQIRRGSIEDSVTMKLEQRNEDGQWIVVPGLTGATVKFSMWERLARVDADSASAQKVLSVNDTEGFSADDYVLIANNTKRVEEVQIATVQAGVSLTMKTNLAYTHSEGDADWVEIVKRRDEDAVLQDADEGLIRYDWKDGETEVQGMYRVLFTLTLSGGGDLIVPARDVDDLLVEIR